MVHLELLFQVDNRRLPYLSRLSYEHAVRVLCDRATELDVDTLSQKWRSVINAVGPGEVDGVRILREFLVIRIRFI